jgi:hypothetical protein
MIFLTAKANSKNLYFEENSQKNQKRMISGFGFQKKRLRQINMT